MLVIGSSLSRATGNVPLSSNILWRTRAIKKFLIRDVPTTVALDKGAFQKRRSLNRPPCMLSLSYSQLEVLSWGLRWWLLGCPGHREADACLCDIAFIYHRVGLQSRRLGFLVSYSSASVQLPPARNTRSVPTYHHGCACYRARVCGRRWCQGEASLRRGQPQAR